MANANVYRVIDTVNVHHITALLGRLQACSDARHAGLGWTAPGGPMPGRFGRVFEIAENCFAFATQVC